MNKNTLQTIAKALLLALVLALIFWLGKRIQRFDWDEYQPSPKCTEPFGVALYDSIVGEALGQKVVQSYGLPKKVKHSESAFLIGSTAYGYWLEDEEWGTYKNLAKKGAVVVIIDGGDDVVPVGAKMPPKADPHGVDIRSVDYHSVTDYKDATAAEVQTYDRTVTFGNGQKTKLRSFLCQSSIKYYDNSFKPICVASDTLTTACLREYPNGGKLIVTTMPLVFTNYSVMDSDARKLSEYMSSFFKGRKLYRLHEEKNKKSVMEEEDGDFKYIMSQPPLKWAFYIILGLLVVYMVFNSRRRMKAIPVYKIDEDTTLQFAKVLGTFYYHQEYHVPFLMKKYDKLKSTLQSRYGWDVDKMEASDLINRLYVITGIRKDRIAKLFILIREYSQDARTISAKKDIIEYIEIIKEIEKNLD
ncbi:MULTISPECIES: hypothetical protein [unclassified Bacteroides]|uniref:hypothetical protein n=1 Tax=unclassified Bacteroides TaxID=2646097 RepID=UPI0004E0C9F2|nr:MULTISPECIES: hypothetical protein [unclassified Bacteroides]